ncbi:tRNA (adenosine(37)-N6)-threonylcarbamoyltransferase complex dimerization subunit type 1 TsaB [Chryseobacterium arthrosphaerae]|uniref:tRNA (Adenosine(37)-N6)-threonylcarbamoyltransferase complex dimerization subunit type 1 TsaB n=1 Tax=Chryseobacterium arthrosphaerae TaxID=651561 RepID=A0A1B8ZHX4_9FLAO|nr:tRNA (adenosine(37)-N6)-threonylcarbamoyltransferase complex dimerization subunit type 1 TsaB [Chryseobacterium arthrosphaerae]AYZ14395.1 tRNA (adenosine(37)-N6)-threonylcarbamoyltransferase complex dimerization subunit type 1 TsaB [Chryseobacterium arthrosphaerae]MDG4654163.1 tRNA (adenosine(37)-N6)-threonylcarbamoyltransferase complex dimerization subunit type 1 TsaB [Chryseobacterium arthrosphaerae]OCA71229.1 tRNA N6-adenosine(37)-N6-threonylcarbamoyltransferase complex dimerization subuni
MKILYLETSSKNCSVAVSDNEKLLCLCEEVSENYKQSESLHTYVEWALEGAGISLKDIEAVSLGKGPGSYTGLRIGAASAKGFCYGLKVPFIAINSLESMIEPFLGNNYDLIVPLIDARRMEVYTAVYDGNTGEELSGTEAKILDETSFEEYRDKKIIFVGDGAKKAKDILQLPDAVFKDDVYPSAQYLIKKTLEKIEKKEFEDMAYFEPFYLKDFHGVKKDKS